VNIKIIACQIIGPAAAGSAGLVPMAVDDSNTTTNSSRHRLQWQPEHRAIVSMRCSIFIFHIQ